MCIRDRYNIVIIDYNHFLYLNSIFKYTHLTNLYTNYNIYYKMRYSLKENDILFTHDTQLPFFTVTVHTAVEFPLCCQDLSQFPGLNSYHCHLNTKITP